MCRKKCIILAWVDSSDRVVEISGHYCYDWDQAQVGSLNPPFTGSEMSGYIKVRYFWTKSGKKISLFIKGVQKTEKIE